MESTADFPILLVIFQFRVWLSPGAIAKDPVEMKLGSSSFD